MKKILLFEEYLSKHFGQAINEASYGDLGFAAILGSTDKQNLGDAAGNIGIEKNTNYTVKIKNIQDLINLGKKKSFEGFSGLVKGSSVADKVDGISVISKGETKEIAPKVGSTGTIILDFDNSPIEITASNNGMLALMRACSAASEVFGEGGVDPQKVKGKLLISMGNPVTSDSSRNAAFLAVSTDISGDNGNLRIGKDQFTEFWFPKIDSAKNEIANSVLESESSVDAEDYLFEEESMKDSSSLVKLVGDSLADSIRAALYQYTKENQTAFPNNSGSYGGFKALYNKVRSIEKIKEANPAPSKISPVVLAMQMQQAIRRLSSAYPMKKVQIDMTPVAKDILSKLGNANSTTLQHKDLEELLMKFKPEAYEKIPQFNPVLGEFWKAIVSAVVIRTAATFAKNAKSPLVASSDAPGKKVGGEEKSGSRANVSGGV